MSEIEDRRQRACESAYDARSQRAREAYWDAHGLEDRMMGRDLQAAIETATRVQITPEAIEAFDVERNGSMDAGDISAGLAGALRELGFEVEQ